MSSSWEIREHSRSYPSRAMNCWSGCPCSLWMGDYPYSLDSQLPTHYQGTRRINVQENQDGGGTYWGVFLVSPENEKARYLLSSPLNERDAQHFLEELQRIAGKLVGRES